jgi:hypothetical protein
MANNILVCLKVWYRYVHWFIMFFRIRLLFGEQLRYFQRPQKPSFIDYIPTFVSG